jgi:hypothetical protein
VDLPEFLNSPNDEALAEASEPKGKWRSGKKRKQKKSRRPTGEVNWSLGTYMPHAEVERTFGVTGLQRSSMVAPNQPFPYKGIYGQWGILSAAVLLIGLLVAAISPRRVVLDKSYQLPPLDPATGSQIVFSEPIQMGSFRNVHVAAQSFDTSGAISITGDFYNEGTGRLRQFELPAVYSAEGFGAGVYLSALPAGTYTMRLEVHRGGLAQPGSVSVRVRRGVPRFAYWLYALLAVSAVPVLTLIGQFVFEQRRWQNSYIP